MHDIIYRSEAEKQMLIQQVESSTIRVAVLQYFAGERSEMLIAISAFMIVAALTSCFYIFMRCPFALGFMITVMLFGSIMSAGLVSLLIRDRSLSRELVSSFQTEQYPAAIAKEVERIGVVLSKFKYYSLGAAVLAVIAMAGFMFSGREWIHGVAAGLLLIVAAQIAIDHFSKRRAQIYIEHIKTIS